MKIKLKILSLLFIVSCGTINAQISVSIQDTIAKKIIDQTKYRVYYDLQYSNDTTQIDTKTQTQTILFVGSKYNRFQDYNAYQKDSIYDALIQQGANSTQIMAQCMPLGRRIHFSNCVIENYPQRNVSTFLEVMLASGKYIYTIPNINFNWTLSDEEKVINSYTCKKATCYYKGRYYIAWYAPELPIACGPYVFSHLPGLIMEIYDNRNHYNFKINGIEKINDYDPIYIETDKVILSTRDNVRKAIQNMKDDPASVIRGMGNAKINDDVLAKLKPKPYNPIELE